MRTVFVNDHQGVMIAGLCWNPLSILFFAQRTHCVGPIPTFHTAAIIAEHILESTFASYEDPQHSQQKTTNGCIANKTMSFKFT